MNPSSSPAGKPGRRWRIFLAWCIHLYTALGLVCATGMVVLILRGDPASFRGAFWLMLLATLIDATDGALARKIRIKEVLPGFDGRRLDDLVDFLTYVAVPLLLIWQAALLPAGWEAVLLLPLLASAYGFCQVSAKTDDGFFLGFPSYWNLVAFYLYILGLPVALNLGILVGLALLTFVPARYLYPSQRGRLNRFTNLLGASWTLCLAGILLLLADEDQSELARRLGVVSLYFPIYYFVVSWVITMRRWRRLRRADREDLLRIESPAPS
jgi:phosphatidylcholine synthase